MTVYQLPPTVLPPATPPLAAKPAGADTLARDLAALGYPGFAHLSQKRRRAKNPAELLLAALAQNSLAARLVEALPWLVLRYWPLDEEWLVREAKVRDLQNRLGFVVTLARRLAERADEPDKARALRALETRLERSRLARQEPLGKAALREPERRWLLKRRPADARRWNLLTDWTVDALRYTG